MKIQPKGILFNTNNKANIKTKIALTFEIREYSPEGEGVGVWEGMYALI